MPSDPPASSENFSLHFGELLEDSVEAREIDFPAVGGEIAALGGEDGLVEVEEKVQRALADAEAGQARQEVVSHEEAEQDDVVQHVFEVVRERNHALQQPELALQILSQYWKLQDLQRLLHVFALAGQRAARLRLFALALRGSRRELEVLRTNKWPSEPHKAQRVTWSVLEVTSSRRM